jgi:hypothetical protein
MEKLFGLVGLSSLNVDGYDYPVHGTPFHGENPWKILRFRTAVKPFECRAGTCDMLSMGLGGVAIPWKAPPSPKAGVADQPADPT